MIFAALERAVLHQQEDEVLTSELTEHLGFNPEPDTNRLLWPRLEGLRRAGLLTTTERRGEPFWSLTDVGRERLASAREVGEVGELPESPQHRAWRHARVKAAVRIEGFGSDLLNAVEKAYSLIYQPGSPTSEEWFELSERLRLAAWRVASAAYCLTEWVEPDDESPTRTKTQDRGRGGGRLGPGIRRPRPETDRGREVGHERVPRRTAQRPPAASARGQATGPQSLGSDRDAAR